MKGDYEAGLAEGLRAAMLVVASRTDVIRISSTYATTQKERSAMEGELRGLQAIRNRLEVRYQKALMDLHEAVEEK